MNLGLDLETACIESCPVEDNNLAGLIGENVQEN